MTATIPTNASDADIGKWIWKNLVPKQGQCAYVQGELIRSIEKLCWEAQNNGNGNWDDRFEMFVSYLREKLGEADCLAAQDLESLHKDLDRLLNFEEPYLEGDLYDRLTSLAIKYCRAQPECIAHEHNPNQYR